MNSTALFVPPLAHPHPSGTTVRISSRDTGGDYCVCEMTTLPGAGVSLHVHERDEEFYYIIEGAYEIQAGAELYVANAGAMVVIPRNVPHMFKNTGACIARALMIFRPGGFDQLLGEMRELGATATVDPNQRQALLAKWGITFLARER